MAGVASEVVEVEWPVVAVDPTVGGVLAHGFAVDRVVPRSALVAGGRVAGVLSDPKAAVGAHVAGYLIECGRLHVHHRPHAGERVDALNEPAHPVAVAPLGVLVGLPVEHEHGLADVVPSPADEEVGLAAGVVAAGVMVQAEALAPVGHTLGLSAPATVLEADTLTDFDDGEVVAGGAGDVRGLPAGHVDADHVGHGDRRRGREQHGDDCRDDCRDRLAFVLELAHSFSFLCWVGI